MSLIIVFYILVCYIAHACLDYSHIYSFSDHFFLQLIGCLGQGKGQGQAPGAGVWREGQGHLEELPLGLSHHHNCDSTGEGTKVRALPSAMDVHPKLKLMFTYHS